MPRMASSQSPMMAAEEDPNSQQQRFLQYLHYIVPAVVFAYFWIAKTISACTLQNLKAKASGTGPRKVLLPLASLLVFSFLVESCMLLIDTAFNGARYSSTDSNVSSHPSVHEYGRKGSHIQFADRTPIRFTLCSHSLFGQFLLSVFSVPRISLCGTRIPVRGSLD